jgi:hypothetical protein
MTNQKEFIQSLFSKKEQKRLWILPAITNGEIVLADHRVITWIHPSGHIGYVFYNGKAFMMDRLVAKKSSDKAGICDWCKSANHMNKLAIFSLKTTENKTNGFYLCSDLDCLGTIKSPNQNSIFETLTPGEKQARYFNNLEKFVSNYLRESSGGIMSQSGAHAG